MAASDLFDFLAGELEQATALSKIESRGTLRIALKAAGLDVKTVRVHEAVVVLERVLPSELESRGIEEPVVVCESLKRRLELVSFDAAPSSAAELVFARVVKES